MKIRFYLIITVGIIGVVHFFSPDWTLTDLTRRGDWVVISFLIVDYLILMRNSDRTNQKMVVCCILLSLLFITTCSVYGEEDERTFSLRILEIIKVNHNVSDQTKILVEGANLISIFVFILLQLSLIFRNIFNRKLTHSTK